MFCIIFRFAGSKNTQRYTNAMGLVTFDTKDQATAFAARLLVSNGGGAEVAFPHYMG